MAPLNDTRITMPPNLDVFGEFASQFHEGMVLDTLPLVRGYLVSIAPTVVTCVDISQVGGFSTMGPREIGAYPVGTTVLVYVHPSSTVGYIVGSIPGAIGSTFVNRPDHIAAFTGSDALNDLPSRDPTERGTFPDVSAGRVIDAIPGSDQGVTNELGLGFGVSRLFAWLRASEAAGLTFFHQDDLARFAAYNLEMWHSGGEWTVKNDCGEVTSLETFSSYAWEALGAFDYGTEALKTNADGGVYKPGARKMWLEPQQPDQIGVPRFIRMVGYLGDVVRELVVLPPQSPAQPVETASSKNVYTGGSEVVRSVDGHVAIRSARGVTIEKYFELPVPKMLQPPDTGAAGDGDGYKFAGAIGDGPDHTRKGFEFTGDPATWPSQVLDYNLYVLNYLNQLSLSRHKKDWNLPELSEGSRYVPAADQLNSKFAYELPELRTLVVDHRGTAQYYLSRSGLDLLPDGTVVLSNGYGNSLVMGAGNTYLQAPGDIWLQPGRNLVAWAGRDMVLRAQKSVDVTASQKDVRIKAERNLHALGGNSGTDGCVLIESRTKNVPYDHSQKGEDAVGSGIVLKSAGELRAYVDRASFQVVQDFVLDCTDLIEVGTRVNRWCQEDMLFTFGAIPSQQSSLPADARVSRLSKAGMEFATAGTLNFRSTGALLAADSSNPYVLTIAGDTQLKGSLVAGGFAAVQKGVITAGSIAAKGTVLAGSMGDLSGGVGKIKGADLEKSTSYDFDKYTTQGQRNSDKADQSLRQAVNGELVQLNRAYYALANSPLSKSQLELIGFTCRTPQQYGTTGDILVAEAAWQQTMRKQGSGFQWIEPRVTGPKGAVTMPHPGYEAWTNDEIYATYDMAFAPWAAGQFKPLTRDAVEKATPVAPKKTQLSSGYLVATKV